MLLQYRICTSAFSLMSNAGGEGGREEGRQSGKTRGYMGTRWNCALFVALRAYRSKIEQQWNKAQMCITGSGFSCPHYVERWTPLMLSQQPPHPTILHPEGLLSPQHTLLPGCQRSTPITTTRTSPPHGAQLTLLGSSHAMPYLRER